MQLMQLNAEAMTMPIYLQQFEKSVSVTRSGSLLTCNSPMQGAWLLCHSCPYHCDCVAVLRGLDNVR